MEDSGFDNLLRTLIASPSRRSVLRTLGTLALGGGMATSFEAAEARKCPECKKKKGGRCKKLPDGTLCSVGTCRHGRCGCSSRQDCFLGDAWASNTGDGQVCQDGQCVCTAVATHRCLETDGRCAECCAPVCPGGRICFPAGPQGPFRCYCNGHVAVECEQVCIPKACEAQCTKSCSGPGVDCGCSGYLSCQAEAPGVYRCLPTGQFVS